MTAYKRERTKHLLKLSNTPQQIAWAKKSAAEVLSDINAILEQSDVMRPLLFLGDDDG